MIIIKECNLYHFEEKLYNIEKDIDIVYKMMFEFVNDFKKHSINDMKYYIKSNFIIDDCIVFDAINSDILKSELCSNANKIKPITICYGLGKSSFYSFNKNIIFINIDLKAIQYNQAKKEFLSPLSHMNKKFKNIINESTLKASISHELTHWIDDCYHNIFSKFNKQDQLLLKQKSVDMTYFEINSQIHSIDRIKALNLNYNSFMFEDLFIELPSLDAIAESLYLKYGKDIFLIWFKNLVTRMNRENLLTKKMETINYDYLESLKSLVKDRKW